MVVRHTAGGGRAIIFDYDSRVIRMRADGTLVGSFPNDQSLGHADSRFAQLDDGQFLQAEFGAAGCARLVRKRGDHPKAPTILVEYEYRDRYFMTAEGPETALLDADPAPEKLRRTGRTFGGWLTAANPIGSLPACRFTGDAPRVRAGTSIRSGAPSATSCAPTTNGSPRERARGASRASPSARRRSTPTERVPRTCSRCAASSTTGSGAASIRITAT